MQHHYPGRSLADLVAGRLTFRQLSVLIKGLPGDGTAMWRAGRRNLSKDAKGSPPPDEYWTPDRDLLASVVDVLNVLAWQPTKDAQKGRNAPKPIRRPGVDDGTKRYGTPTTAARVLQLLRPGRGGGEPVDPHGQP